MKWSWRLARIAGIELRVHATFLILLAWIATVFYRGTGTVGGAAWGVVFMIALFASVVLHELGHALMARRFGVPTRDITLLPIGGVARLEYMPDKPREELLIAVAGPAVTLAIALTIWLALLSTGTAVTSADVALGSGGPRVFVVQLMWVNVTLLLFNLLPAFPMDGGRVLRALLAMRMPYVRATHIATRIGRLFALLFGIVGLMYNPFLVIIALFVWLAAAGEAQATQTHAVLGGVSVERVMIRHFQTVAPTDTLEAALRHVLDGFQSDFPVVEEGRVVGVLTRGRLLEGLARDGRDEPIASAMEKSFRTTRPDEPVEHALATLAACKCRTLPVIHDGVLAGVLTPDNIAEYVMIETTLRSAQQTT